MPKTYEEHDPVHAEARAQKAVSVCKGELSHGGDDPAEEPQPIQANEVSSLDEPVGKAVENVEGRRNECLRLEELSARVLALEAKANEGQKPSTEAHITTFAPEPFLLLKDIEVVLEPTDGECIASFYDANVSSQGGTPPEAIANLKDLLLSRFDYLDKLPPEKKLGPIPRKQIAVLREFIRRRD